MDADDISVSDRFEKQFTYMVSHPKTTIVGGNITEFISQLDGRDISHKAGKRIVPSTDCEIKNYMKKRCPMNQMTVMFRKKAISSVGGYKDWYCDEDYYLWIRMAEKGYKFYNIQDNLVFVRVSNGMYGRRGGWRYFRSEKRVQKYMLEKKIINFTQYVYNVSTRFIAEVLITDKMRSFLYKTLLRK